MYKTTTYILCACLFLFANLNASNIQNGLPDTNEGFHFWNEEGEFIGGLTLDDLPPIPSVEVIPEANGVGQSSVYGVDITLGEPVVPNRGGILLSFPGSFGIDNLMSVEYTDDFEGADLEILVSFVYEGEIYIVFDDGESPPAGSVVSIRLEAISNPFESDSYQIAAALFDINTHLVAGPTLSESFDILAMEPVSLELFPEEDITIKAGEDFVFEARVIDIYGNIISGADIEWSFADPEMELGFLSGGHLISDKTGQTRIVASFGTFADTSGLVTVIPGDFDHFGIEAVSYDTEAGEPLESEIRISAYDYFDNLKIDYIGAIWFETTDPQAEILFDLNNQYQFTEADLGERHFSPNDFVFITSGEQTLTVTDGAISESITIDVEPGMMVSYGIRSSDVLPQVGNEFVWEIVNAGDEFGNPANGIIAVSLIFGPESPYDFEPIYDKEIAVENGRGMLVATTYSILGLQLGLTIDTVYKEVSLSSPVPGLLDDLILDIGLTQFGGNKLIGESTIMAVDEYGNPKVDYESLPPMPIRLNAWNGEFSPDSVLTTDFDNGMVFLNMFDISYIGDPGEVNVYVSSEADGFGNPQVNSNLQTITFNGFLLDTTINMYDTVFVGTEYSPRIHYENVGNLANTNDIKIKSFFKSDTTIGAYQEVNARVEPGEAYQETIDVGTVGLTPNTTDSFFVIFETEYEVFYGSVSEIYIFADTFGYEVEILDGFSARYIDNSLSLGTVLNNSVVDELEIQATIDAPFDISEALLAFYLTLSDNDGNSVLLDDGRQDILLDGNLATIKFNELVIPDLQIVEPMQYNLSLGGVVKTEQFFDIAPVDNFDSILIALPLSVEFLEGSLSPTITYNNTAHAFEFDLNINGVTNYFLDRFASRLELRYNDDLLAGYLAEDYDLSAGNNGLKTTNIFIPEHLIGAELTPMLILAGDEIYAPRVDTLLFGEQKIYVDDNTNITPRLQIKSADLVTVNPPYLNYGQEFGIAVTIDNISDYPVDSVSIYILSEGGDTAYAEAHGITISALNSYDTTFALTAPEQSLPTEIYRAEISAPSEVEVVTPEDNTVSITVQSPAVVGLALDLSDIDNNYVEFDQPFSLSARFVNDGEANAGGGEISLIISNGDFGISDSSGISIEFNGSAEWNLVAPPMATDAEFRFKITEPPLDLNTGQAATISTSSIAVPINVETSSGELIVGGETVSSSLIFAGDEIEVYELSLFNNSANPQNLIAIRSIRIDINDRHGLSITPSEIVDEDSSGFYENGQLISSCYKDDERLLFEFDLLTIEPGQNRYVALKFILTDNLIHESFRVKLDSRDIRATFIDGPRLNQTAPVLGEVDDIMMLEATFNQIEDDLESSLQTRNNPFNPDLEPAEISYALPYNQNVKMTIYTLLGEKVYEFSYPSGGNGGSSGINIVEWNGQNESGKVVLNGIYIAVIRPEIGDKSYKLKIAVMK